MLGLSHRFMIYGDFYRLMLCVTYPRLHLAIYNSMKYISSLGKKDIII